ncbi:hypothetical protein AB6A40_003355 [Gnathostoma spinigerum]|uniref:CULT domain-containing protein n=1 Tax=Gnathostoma spinigerum TaxID=75299 RepID=A0ABD6EGY7_9BILA
MSNNNSEIVVYGNDAMETSSDSTQSDEDDMSALEAFDIRLPSLHQYLHFEDNDVTRRLRTELPGTVLNVTILDLPVVLMPFQRFPFLTSEPRTVAQLKQAFLNSDVIAAHPYLGVVPTDVATLIQIEKLDDNEHETSIQAVGRQRCKIVHRGHQINGVPYGKVEVLEDQELPPFPTIFQPACFLRFNEYSRLKIAASLSHFSYFAVKSCSTAAKVALLRHWLSKIHPLEKIDHEIQEGWTRFSYWVASNLPIGLQKRLPLLEEKSTNRRLLLEWSIVSGSKYMLCSNCENKLGQVSNLIILSTEGISAHYVNPGGYVHDMLTMSKLCHHASLPVGEPSAEFSWFPGYKWTIQECKRCRRHIGWKFTSDKLKPRSFYGLTKSAIVLDEPSCPD